MAPKGGLAKWLKACFLCGPDQELSEPAYKSYPKGWHQRKLKNGAAYQGYSISHGQNNQGLEGHPLNEQACGKVHAKGFLGTVHPTEAVICSSDKQVVSGESSRTPSETISLRSSLEAPVAGVEQAHAADNPSSEVANVAEPVATEPARADGDPSSELADVAAPAAAELARAGDHPSPELVDTAGPVASEPSGAGSPPPTDLADVTAPVASEAVPAGDRSSVKPADAAGPVASEPACASDNPVSDLAQPVPSDLPNAGDQAVPPSPGSEAQVEVPVAGLPMFVKTSEGDVLDIIVRPDMKYVTYDDVKYWPARGKGGFSDINVGCVMRPSWNTGRQKFVSKTMQDKRMLKVEVEMMQHLNHPNIIPLEGVVKSSEASQEIVGYLLPNLEGDFLDYLAQCKKQDPDFQRLSVEECMSIALDVLAALCYLHQRNIIQGDLKGANILRKKVNGEWIWVLIDFGLSVYAGTYTECLPGSPSYVSPEFLRGTVEKPQLVTTQSDMHVFGCLMYELYTGHKPWDTRNIVDIVNEKYDGNIALPEKPDDVPDFYWDMIVRCQSDDPSMRPTAAQAFAEIEEELYRDVK